MRLSEIEQIVAGGESTTVEFKATTGQRIAAAKIVCAMLNGRGGFVLFGVSPRSSIVGQLIGEGTVEELSNELRKIDPPSSILYRY